MLQKPVLISRVRLSARCAKIKSCSMNDTCVQTNRPKYTALPNSQFVLYWLMANTSDDFSFEQVSIHRRSFVSSDWCWKWTWRLCCGNYWRLVTTSNRNGVGPRSTSYAHSLIQGLFHLEAVSPFKSQGNARAETTDIDLDMRRSHAKVHNGHLGSKYKYALTRLYAKCIKECCDSKMTCAWCTYKRYAPNSEKIRYCSSVP